VNSDFNFDNIYNAVISLFVLALTEGWTALMWQGVDMTAIDRGPRMNNNMFWSIYY
jgi:hypothetical protein